MEWSVRPVKDEFQRKEPVVLAYQLLNRSPKDVWIPKSIDPFASVRFRIYGPDGHLLQWTGSRFTFGYGQSDLEKLRPDGEKSGTFVIPSACPDEKAVEKGGFCFQKPGAYQCTAEFEMGLNAIYNRKDFQGQVAEGPYPSKKFAFTIR